METNWAADHLQTIRTLMERSALYRRALAPIMIRVGIIGLVAATLCYFLAFGSTSDFVLYWMSVGALTVVTGFLMIRKQALQAAEPFWSPPTRRIIQAMLPASIIGAFLGILFSLHCDFENASSGFISAIWCICYGCALHAAGFFAPRGLKLLGWLFIGAGGGYLLLLSLCFSYGVGSRDLLVQSLGGRGLFMGLMFGGLHLAYGIYLRFTEQRKNAA